jgi:hypothetical protein
VSHRDEVKTQMKSEEMLVATCVKLKIPYQRGQHTVDLYDGACQCDFSMKLPGWQYPVAVRIKTGEAVYDNYNGSWGNIEEFQKVNQEYGLQVAEHEEGIQTLVAEGWQIERVPQKNGDVQLRLSREGR